MGDADEASALECSTTVGVHFLGDMDPAFIRAGRIDEVMLVLPPDAGAREQILDIHCRMKNVPLDPMEKVDFKALADKTFFWTGAELQKLVTGSAYKALEADAKYVTIDHFEEAMKDIEVNITERTNTVQKMINDMNKTEGSISKAFLKASLKQFRVSEGNNDRVSSFVEGLTVETNGKEDTKKTTSSYTA